MPTLPQGGPYRDQRPALRERIAELEQTRDAINRDVDVLRRRLVELDDQRWSDRTDRASSLMKRAIPYALVVLLVCACLFVSSFAFISDVEIADMDAMRMRVAARRYATAHDACPTVAALVREGYLSEDTERSDPWSNEYQIECDGAGQLTVCSMGPDGQARTDDDLCVRDTGR